MENALRIAINRETRRAGTSVVTDKDKLMELTNKSTNVLMGAAFEKDEIIELTPEKAAMMAGEIRGGNEQFRFMVHTNKGTKNLYLTTFHKSRVLVDESDPKNPVVTDERKDNYACQLGQFFEACPSQLIFAAAIAGTKIKCTKDERIRAAGFDPKGGPNGQGGTDYDPAHATNARLNDFEFVGKKLPEIKEEWLGEDGDEKAAEYLLNYFHTEG